MFLLRCPGPDRNPCRWVSGGCGDVQRHGGGGNVAVQRRGGRGPGRFHRRKSRYAATWRRLPALMGRVLLLAGGFVVVACGSLPVMSVGVGGLPPFVFSRFFREKLLILPSINLVASFLCMQFGSTGSGGLLTPIDLQTEYYQAGDGGGGGVSLLGACR